MTQTEYFPLGLIDLDSQAGRADYAALTGSGWASATQTDALDMVSSELLADVDALSAELTKQLECRARAYCSP